MYSVASCPEPFGRSTSTLSGVVVAGQVREVAARPERVVGVVGAYLLAAGGDDQRLAREGRGERGPPLGVVGRLRRGAPTGSVGVPPALPHEGQERLREVRIVRLGAVRRRARPVRSSVMCAAPSASSLVPTVPRARRAVRCPAVPRRTARRGAWKDGHHVRTPGLLQRERQRRRPPRRHRRSVGMPAPPRPGRDRGRGGRRRLRPVRGRRVRAQAAGDHRRGVEPRAAALRGRPLPAHLQRRDLQLHRAARGADPRTSAPSSPPPATAR